MDLTDETGQTSPRRADPALGNLPATAITDLAGTDTKIVFVARHETTIGSQPLSRKSNNAVHVMQRGNTCASEDTAISDLPHVAGDGPRSIEREAQSERAPLTDLDGTSKDRPKTMCRQTLRNEVPGAGKPALSCLPNRAHKVNSQLRYFAICRT
jgi:hypothetical protein